MSKRRRDTKWLDQLRVEAIALVNKSNSKFRPERQVTRQAALAVVDRSLAYTSNSSQEIRSFAALRALSSFVSLATISKATVSSLENADLLPVGHPFSTAPHAMSASALRSARAQWIASDPLVDDSIRSLVASAHSLEPGSIERQHAFARLIAAGPQLVPITAAIDVGDTEIVTTYAPAPVVAGLLSFVGGNSRAARSMRAKLQRRDRYGRFAFMGGGFSFKMKMVDGSFRSFSGRVVGRGTEADANSGLVEVELMRGSNGINVAGQIVKVPSNKGTAVKAIIPQEGLEGLPDQGEVQPDDVFVSGAQMIQSKTGAPDGWKPVKMAKDSNGKEYATQWESPDGYVVNGVGKYNHTEDYENVGPGSAGRATHRQPQLQPARQELDFVDFPAVDTWADVEDVISRDQNDYESDLKKYNSLDGDDAAQKAWVAEQEAKGRKNAADKPQILREESDSFAEQLQDAVGDDKGIRFNVNGQDVALKPTEVTDTSVKGTDENGEEREIKLADIKSMSEEAAPAEAAPAEAATPGSEFDYKEALATLRDPKASMDEKFDAVFRTAKGTPTADRLPELNGGQTYADIPEGSEVVFGEYGQTFLIRTPDGRYANVETGATNEKNQVTPDYVDSIPKEATEWLRELLNIGPRAGIPFAQGGFDDDDFAKQFMRGTPSDEFDYKEALATSTDPNATPNDKFDAIFQALDGVPVADVLKELSGGQTYADIPKGSVALFTAFDGDEILIRKPDGKYAIIALGATNDKNQVTPDDVDAMPTQAGEYIAQLLDDHDYFRGGFTNKEFDDEFRSQRAAAEAGGGKGAEPPKPPSSRVSGPLEPGESGPGWTAYSSSKLSYSHQPNTDSVYKAHTITERVGTDGSTYEVWRMGWGVANQAYGDNINVARGLASWNDAIDAIDADMVEVNKINAKANEKAAAAEKAAEAARYIPLGDRGEPGTKNPVARITETRWIKPSGNVRMSNGSQTIYFNEEDGDGIYDAKKDGFRIVSETGGASEQREVPKYRPSTGVTRDLLPFESRQQLENAINAVISKGDNIRFKYGAKEIVFQPSKIYDNKKNGNRNVTGWSVTDGAERTYNVDKISAMPEAPKAPQAAEAPIDAASAALEFVYRKISDTEFLQKIRGLEEAGEISSDQAQKIGDVVADYDNGNAGLDRDDLFSSLNNIISGEVSQEPDEVDFNFYTDPRPDLNRRRIQMAMDKKQRLRVHYKGKDRVIDPQSLWVNPKTGKELVTALDMSDGGKEKNFFINELDGEKNKASGFAARPVLTTLSDEEIANAQQNALNFREKFANDPDFKKFVQDSPRNTGVQQLLDTYENRPQEGPVDLTSIDQDGLSSAIEEAIASGKDVSFVYHEKPRVVTPIEITVNPKNNRPKLRGFEYAADAEKEFFLDKFAKPVDSKLKQTQLDDIVNLPQEDLDQIVDALWPAPRDTGQTTGNQHVLGNSVNEANALPDDAPLEEYFNVLSQDVKPTAPASALKDDIPGDSQASILRAMPDDEAIYASSEEGDGFLTKSSDGTWKWWYFDDELETGYGTILEKDDVWGTVDDGTDFGSNFEWDGFREFMKDPLAKSETMSVSAAYWYWDDAPFRASVVSGQSHRKPSIDRARALKNILNDPSKSIDDLMDEFVDGLRAVTANDLPEQIIGKSGVTRVAADFPKNLVHFYEDDRSLNGAEYSKVLRTQDGLYGQVSVNDKNEITFLYAKNKPEIWTKGIKDYVETVETNNKIKELESQFAEPTEPTNDDRLDVINGLTKLPEDAAKTPAAKPTGLQEIDTKGSTAVKRAAYDPQTQDLFIQFGSKDGKGGGIYKYSDVPQDFVDRFAAADSLGKMIPELKKSGKSEKVDAFPATGAAAQLAEDLAYRRAAAREFFTALSKVMEAFHLDFEDLFGLGVTTEVERGDKGLAQSALAQFDDAFDSITTVFTTPLSQSEIDDLTNNFFSKYKKAKNRWVRSLGEAFDVSRTGQGASDGLEDYEYDKDLAEAFKSDPSTLIEGMRRGPRKFIFDIGYTEDVEETIRRYTEDYGFTAELTGSDWHGGYPGVEVTVDDSSIASTDLANMLGLTDEDYAAAQKQGDKMLAGYRVDLPEFYAEGGEDYVQNQQDVDRWTSRTAVQVEARFIEPGVVRFFGSPEDLRDAIAIAAGEDSVDALMANVYRERPADEVPTSTPGEIDDSQIIESIDAPSVFSEAMFDDAFPAVGEGFYKVNIFDRYVPKGAADDVQSSDYTDDPAVLANKFSAITLLWTLKNAISPDEETGAPATGYGLLKFDKADEYVSAEAVYEAVSRLGVGDVEVILAGIYDAGVGGEENQDRALERSAIRARDAANAPIDSFSKSIIDMTDSSRSSQVDQAKILNGMLANPDSASRVVRSLENFVEPNDKLVDIADRLMWIQDNDPDEQSVNMGTFLDQYLPLATSPSDTDREAFRGIWGMLMSTDGGDSIDFEGLTDSDDHFRARVFQALVRAEGSELAAQDAYEELIGAYGGYPEFVIGRQRLADGEDDLNSKTTAAAFARLVAAAARPNVEKLYRYVGVSKDNSALLDMYITQGSVFDMDPRSFTSSDVTKGDPEQQDSRNKGFDRVYFVLEPGDGMTISARHISPFEMEKEHFGYGTFEVMSVESSFIKLGSLQEKHIVRIKQVSSRGQNTDYEPTTENIVPDYGDISMWKETGYATQAGSNEGGFFKDPYGKRYYIKKGRSQSHVDNETLATAFYNELGLPSPAQGFGMRDGELYLVSPIISDQGNFLNMLGNEEFMSQVRDGFAVDAWLSNYDVTGWEFDNIVPGENGEPFRIDNGGALRWRATGGAKPWFDEDVTELDTMRDPDLAKIPAAAEVFGDMTEDDVARSARRLLDITPSRIIDMVASAIKDPDEAREVSRILIARREQILSRYGLDTINPDADILGEPTSLATSMGHAARDLQPEDITAGDSFTIERVFHDADTPKGKISVEGYFPGHETQRKEWNEGTVIDVFRGAPTPPKGDKPALHRPKRPFEPKPPAFTGAAAELLDGAANWEEVRDRLRGREVIFFDYETTGFPDRDKGDFSTNQPVQLGAVRVVNGEIADRFNVYMNPSEALGLWSRDNLKRDGGVLVTDDWLSEQPGKDDAHRQFIEWAGQDAIFAAHNAPFDLGVFNKTIADAGIDYTPAGVIDTLKLSQQFMPSKSQKVKPDPNGPLNHKLPTLIEFFGGELEGWHTADADAEAVASVLGGILGAITDKPLPDLTKDAQKYAQDKEKFDRAQKEYAQALLDYETAKAVAAAWNCGGGGIKAAGDPYGEGCNVPSIDDIIRRATPDESDFVDPDGIHSGPTDGSSSPLPDRGADDLEDYIIPFPESVDPADLFAFEKFTPTLQQQNIIAAWLTGEDVVVLAKAGTGKTTTLTLGARVIQSLEPGKRLLYIAYNRSVADEASTKFPPNTIVKTSDAVAYNFMRLQYPDMFKKFKNDAALFNKDDIAKFLGLSKVKIGDEVYEAAEIASMVQDTIFKFEISSDPMLNMGHVFEAEVPSELSDVVFSAAQMYWSDILDPDGKMPFAFNEMKKLWSMSKPDFSGTDAGVDRPIDVVMLDEAQDTNDAVGSVVLNQAIQVIMVGDPDQAIYQFNGAKDQLQNAVAPYRLPLTESWRYGPEIGGFANRFLALKERVHGVKTNRGIGRGPAGQVLPAGTMKDAEAVIVRSNAGAFKDILIEIEAGRTVGVTKSFYADLKGFIEATEWLKLGGGTSGKKRPARMPEDLRGFRSWKDVVEEADKGDKSDLGTKTGILVATVEAEGIEGLYDLLGKIQQIESVSDAKKSMGGGTGTAARSEFDLPDELGVGAYGQLTDGISFSIDPVGVIITGKKTFPYKETLKKVADWNGKSKVWKISASTDASRRDALEKLQNMIRDLEGYGSTPEARAEQGIDVVVSTAHQMKGLEFGQVRVGADFRGPRKDKTTGEIIWPNVSEMNLAYVTATRAINALDPGSLDWIYDSTNASDESSFPELAGQEAEAEAEAEEQDATPVPEVTDESGDGGAEEPPAITTAPSGDGPSDDEKAVYNALDAVFYAIQDAADTKGNKDFGAKAGINALTDLRKKLSVIFSDTPALNDLIDEAITGIETKKFDYPEDGIVDAQKKLPAIFGREAAQEPGTVETAQDDSADIVTAPDMPSVDEPMTDEQVSEVVEETPQLVEAGSFNLEFIRERFAEADSMFDEAANNMKRSSSKDIVADVREGVNEVLRDLVAGNITLDDAYEKLAEVADSVPEQPLTSKNPDAAEIEALTDYVNSIRDAIEEVKYGRRLSEHLPPPELLNKVGEPMGTSKNGILIRRGMRVRDKNGFAGRVLDYNKTDWLGVFVRFDLDPRAQEAVKKGNWGPGVARMIRTASTLDVIGEDDAPWADVRNDAQKKKDEDKGNDPRPPSFDQQLEIYNNMVKRRSEETWSGEESDRSDDDDDDGDSPDGGGTEPTPSDDGGGGGNFPKVEAPQGAPEAPEVAEVNKALDSYANTRAYETINMLLRDGEDATSAYLTKVDIPVDSGIAQARTYIDSIDSAIENASPIETPMTLYRGVGGKNVSAFFDGLAVGSTYKDLAYVSTTTSEGRASSFPNNTNNNLYTVEIVAGPGTKGVFVADVLGGEGVAFPDQKPENEFLIARGTEFRVLSKDDSAVDGRKKIKVEVVTSQSGQAPEDIAELARWNKVKPIQDPAQFLSEIEDDLWRESSQFAKFIYEWEDKQSYDDYFLDGAYYYMGGGAEDVNSWLAGLENPAEGPLRPEEWFNSVVKTLDKLISLFPKTKKDMLVYRGVDKRRKNEPLIDMLSSLQPGDEFNNVAYSSTSIVESVAQKFKGKAGYLLEIVVPKGSRGFFADPANGLKFEDDEAYSNPESFSEMEAEFILPRNTVFKVISREGDKIKVVVVPKEKDKSKTEDLSSAFVKAEAPQSPVEKVEESEVDAADIDQQWQVMPASKSPDERHEQFDDYYRGLDFSIDPFINNNVTREQERASYGMIAYQAEDYSLINGLLRNRITVEEEVYGEFGDVIDPVEYKATVKQIYSMDMLYENAPTIPEDMVLYRGIHSDYSDKLMRSYEVGDLFQDPAYSSTTTSPASAEIWASSHNADYVPSVPSKKPPGLVLEIVAPAGTRGIYLPAYLGGQVDHGDELEVLLDRGTTFRVITKIEDADGNTRVMRVAVVDQTKKPIDPNEPWSAPEEKITEPDAPEAAPESPVTFDQVAKAYELAGFTEKSSNLPSEGLIDYITYGTEDINGILIAEQEGDSEWQPEGGERETMKKFVEEIDKIMDQAPKFDVPVTVYRGTIYSKDKAPRVGQTVESPRYLSTSLSPLVAEDFTRLERHYTYGEVAIGLGAEDVKVVYEIEIPPGEKFLSIPHFLPGIDATLAEDDQFADKNWQVEGIDGQQEMLLARDSEISIVEVTQRDDGMTLIKAKLIKKEKAPVAPEVDNSPETVNRLGSEVSNPAEADAVVIDRTPPDEVLVELLREGGSQTVGSKFNENWATYIEELPQKKFEETYTFPKTGKTAPSLKKRYKDLAEFLTEFAQNSTFDTSLPVAKYNIPGSSFRTLPGVEVDVDEDGDARFTIKDGIGVLFAQAIAAYSSGAAYTGTRNNEEGIAARIKRFRGQRTSENLSGVSPGSLMGVNEIHESLYDFWRSYAAIMNDPSLLDVDYPSQNEHSVSLAGHLLQTLSFAGKLDGTFVRTLTFEDVDIDSPEHPLHALTSVGQEIAMRPSSWAKFGEGGGTSDDDGLFTAEGFGYPGSLGDVALFITDPEGLAIGDFTAMAENEALLKNGRYRVVSVEKVTATRKAWDLDIEDYVVGEHTYTKITLEQSKPKEALTPVKNPEKYQYNLGKIYDNALGDDVNDANAAAMRLYQEDQNMWVATNYRLRGTKPASRIEEEHNVELSDLDTIIKAFDEEIDKVPGLPIDTLLYRGTRNRSAEKLFSLAVGEEFTDLGFVSTSLEYDTAEMFSRDVDVLSGVILEIEAPAGTKGISLAAYFGDTVDTETEVVLARGTTFVVKSKTDAIDGDSRKMRIAIIDQTTSVEQEPVKADEDDVTYNDIENWTKVGPKKGSNEGGTFRDQSGNDYYVKEPRSTLHAQNEALAAALYKELQVPAVEVFLGEKNGELRTVSPIVESIGVLGYNPERSVIEKLQEGFAVDAWLANWDIAGLTFDNVIIDEDGNPIRVDPGGALMWRAQGEPKGKMFGDVAGEIDTLRSESKAPEASVIFGDMTDDQVRESAKVLLNISPERIDKIVDSIISDFADAADLKMKLRNRRQSILDRFGLTDADKLDEPVEETPTEEQVPDNSTEMVTTLGADVSMPNVLVEGRGAAPDHTPRDKELVARLVAEGPQAQGSQFVENWAKLYEEYDGSDTEAKDAAMFIWEMNMDSVEKRAETDAFVQNAVIGFFASTMSYARDYENPRPQLGSDLADWREDFPTDLVQDGRLSEKSFWRDIARYFDDTALIDKELTPASAFLRVLRAWEGSGNPPQEYDRFLTFFDKKITDDDHPLKYMLTPGQEVVLRPSSWTNAGELTNFDDFLTASHDGAPSDWEDYEQVGDQISPLEVGHVVLRVAVDNAYAIDQMSHVEDEKESIIPNGRYRVKSVERVNEPFFDDSFVSYTLITLEVVPLERKKKAAPSEALAEAAGELGVNIDAYYDEALDIDDVEQATNKFSLAKTEHMTASDAVIIKRSDEGDLIAMIEREFGPFRGAYALPGGMLDAGETFAQAADREMQEEVGFDAANAVSRKNLGSVTDSPDWDPRFVNGVSVGAVSYVVPDGTELTAQDDARAALWIPVEDLANGIYPIAFGHAAWLAEHYKGGILGDKFEVIVEASKERNARLIEKINEVREELGEPTFTQYGKDAPWWSPVAAVEEITKDLDSPLQLDYKEWRGGSSTYVDEDGVTIGVDVDYDDVYALKNGSLKPPALPFFVPLYSSGAQDSGEGYYFAKSGKRYWGRYGAAGALLRRVKEDGTLEYLLAKRSANISAGGGQWAWPGGAHKDKKHAQSPQLTAYEELKEELGVYPEGIDPIATHTNFVEPDWQYETMIVDVTNNSSLTDSLKISDDENSDLGWFTEDEIRDLNDNGMLHPAVASSIEQVLAISRVYDSPLELPVYEPKEQPEMPGTLKITQTGRPKVTPENPLPLSASAIDGTYSVMDAIHHVKNSDDVAVSAFVDGGDIEDLEVRASIVVDEPTGEKKLSLRFKLTAWAADRLLDPIRFVRNNNKEDVINPAKRKALKLSGDLSEAEIVENPVMPAQFYVDPASGTVVSTGGAAKIVRVSAAQGDANRPVIYEGSILIIDDSKGKTGAVYEIVDRDGDEFSVPDYNIPIQERPYAYDGSAMSYDNTVRIYLPLDATEDQIAVALRAAGVQDVRAGTNEDLKVIAENRLLSIFKQYTDPAKNMEDQQVRDALLDSIKKLENVTTDDIEFRISDTGRVEMMFSEEKAKELAQRLEIDRFEHELPNMRAGMMYYVDNPNVMFGGISAVPREYVTTAAAKSILRTISANRLSSTMSRLLEGNQDTGMSSDADIKKGSADYVFTTPMNVKTSLSAFSTEESANDLSATVFVFSAEKLLRRLDIYGNREDQFGQRFNSHNIYSEIDLSTYRSAYEAMFKHDIDFGEYLTYISVAEDIRNEILDMLSQSGITTMYGIPVEELFVVHGDVPNRERIAKHIAENADLVEDIEQKQLSMGANPIEFRAFADVVAKVADFESDTGTTWFMPAPDGSKILGLVRPGGGNPTLDVYVQEPSGGLYLYSGSDAESLTAYDMTTEYMRRAVSKSGLTHTLSVLNSNDSGIEKFFTYMYGTEDKNVFTGFKSGISKFDLPHYVPAGVVNHYLSADTWRESLNNLIEWERDRFGASSRDIPMSTILASWAVSNIPIEAREALEKMIDDLADGIRPVVSAGTRASATPSYVSSLEYFIETGNIIGGIAGLETTYNSGEKTITLIYTVKRRVLEKEDGKIAIVLAVATDNGTRLFELKEPTDLVFNKKTGIGTFSTVSAQYRIQPLESLYAEHDNKTKKNRQAK